jgi:uncharacterized protein
VVLATYGTLIGAGGGFILSPVLLLLFPRHSAAQLTAVSLMVVSANAVSGSIRYLRMRRVDLHSGVILAAATLPGAVIGALVVGALPRRLFDLLMGGLLLVVALFLVVNPHGGRPLWRDRFYATERLFIDASGTEHIYRFNLPLAALSSLGLGFVSSLLGIGGGVIQVPLLTTFFDFPAHVATATSLFILMFTAGAGTLTHVVHGDYDSLVSIAVALAAGAVIGAQVGARLSHRVAGQNIIRLLTLALAIVGVRLLIQAI